MKGGMKKYKYNIKIQQVRLLKKSVEISVDFSWTKPWRETELWWLLEDVSSIIQVGERERDTWDIYIYSEEQGELRLFNIKNEDISSNEASYQKDLKYTVCFKTPDDFCKVTLCINGVIIIPFFLRSSLQSKIWKLIYLKMMKLKVKK